VSSNRLILENARRASELCTMIVRIPIVPGFTDSEENVRATAAFVRELGGNVQRIELVPYHKLGVHRYSQLGRRYGLDEVEEPAMEYMERLEEIVLSAGNQVQIGG